MDSKELFFISFKMKRRQIYLMLRFTILGPFPSVAWVDRSICLKTWIFFHLIKYHEIRVFDDIISVVGVIQSSKSGPFSLKKYRVFNKSLSSHIHTQIHMGPFNLHKLSWLADICL